MTSGPRKIPRAAAVQAIVFDLGNVLIEIDFMRCVHAWSHRGRIPPEQIMARFRMDRSYEAFEQGHLPAGAYFETLRRQLGLQLDDAIMADGWNRIIGGEKPGIRECILKLKPHFPLYVLTNTNAVHAAAWGRRHRELLRHFAHLFVSSEMGCRKPDSAAFRAVAAFAGVPAERILFLDDSPENVEGATMAGMQAIRVQQPEDIPRLTSLLLAGRQAGDPGADYLPGRGAGLD